MADIATSAGPISSAMETALGAASGGHLIKMRWGEYVITYGYPEAKWTATETTDSLVRMGLLVDTKDRHDLYRGTLVRLTEEGERVMEEILDCYLEAWR